MSHFHLNACDLINYNGGSATPAKLFYVRKQSLCEHFFFSQYIVLGQDHRDHGLPVDDTCKNPLAVGQFLDLLSMCSAANFSCVRRC